ncbi:MAG: hypothetical protein R6U38_03180 [Desulfatiglandaceae bacterium]
MKQLTIRKVSSELDRAIAAESRLKGQSINQTVLDLLHQTLGLGLKERFDNGLRKQAGTWSEDEFREFEKHTDLFEKIDPELWEK